MKVRTESGSLYELDTDKKIWRRTVKGPTGGDVRHDGEWMPYIAFTGSVGYRLVITMEPLPESAEGTKNRVLISSEIIEVTE